MSDVWGCAVMSWDAARALGEASHHGQVRAVVLATSRAAAGRYLTAAGFFYSPASASNHLRDYGSTSRNANELSMCTEVGQVYVTPMSFSGERFLPWPEAS